MKTIVLSPTAAKQLDRIFDQQRVAIVESLAAYALGKPADTKAMVGSPTVRMRIGDYRIIFDETPHSITVLAIGHRREIYR